MLHLRPSPLLLVTLLLTACPYVDYQSPDGASDDGSSTVAVDGSEGADGAADDWIVTEEDIDELYDDQLDGSEESDDGEPAAEEDDSWEESPDEERADAELFSALGASSGARVAAQPLTRKKRFRVLNWNIAGGKENNCATAGIKRAVMRYVREANGPVDFISLNEVCPAQFRAIRAALRNHWGKSRSASFAAFVGSGGSRVGNAIFSRRNLRKITRHEVGSDQFGKRFLLCGLQKNRRVRVCSTHLSPADNKAGVQLGRVLNRIESWWDNQRDTVILAGDLNIQPNDRALNKMYSRHANTRNNRHNHGKYREWDDDDGDHCRGYGEGSQPGSAGGPCRQGSKIDFVFTRGNRIVNGKYGANTLAIPNDCTGVCSDHRAIRGWADLRFRVD